MTQQRVLTKPCLIINQTTSDHPYATFATTLATRFSRSRRVPNTFSCRHRRVRGILPRLGPYETHCLEADSKSSAATAVVSHHYYPKKQNVDSTQGNKSLQLSSTCRGGDDYHVPVPFFRPYDRSASGLMYGVKELRPPARQRLFYMAVFYDWHSSEARLPAIVPMGYIFVRPT